MKKAREIHKEIDEIRDIGQFTQAMRTNAQSKMIKAETEAKKIRAFILTVVDILTDMERHINFPQGSMDGKCLIIAVTPTRGLTGGFNRDVFDNIDILQQHYASEAVWIVLGNKGIVYTKKKKFVLLEQFLASGTTNIRSLLSEIASYALFAFRAGEYKKIILLYEEKVSSSSWRVVVEQMLPRRTRSVANVSKAPPEVAFEPSQEDFQDNVLKMYFKYKLWHALKESLSAEHTARSVAMDQATEAAEDIEEMLTLDYNKVRQTQITFELLDIVGGGLGGRQ